LQFFEVCLRKRPQSLFALSRQLHQDAPAVVVIRDSSEQAEPGHAVDQLDRGMMPDQQDIREVADGNGLHAGEALDGEQRLVLLGRQPGLLGSRFAERQKLSEPKAKLSKSFVIDVGRGAPDSFAARDRRLSRLLPFRSLHPALRVHKDEHEL